MAQSTQRFIRPRSVQEEDNNIRQSFAPNVEQAATVEKENNKLIASLQSEVKSLRDEVKREKALNAEWERFYSTEKRKWTDRIKELDASTNMITKSVGIVHNMLNDLNIVQEQYKDSKQLTSSSTSIQESL